MATSEVIPIRTCNFCEVSDVRTCVKCQKSYCPNHASKISPQFCQDCFSQVTLTIEKYTKVSEDYDVLNEKLIHRRTSGKVIRLDGPDYVWYSVAIQHITNDELGVMREFHKFIVSQIEYEQAVRLVKKTQEVREEEARLKSEGKLKFALQSESKTKKVIKTKSVRESLIAAGIKEGSLQFIALMKAAGEIV